MTTTRILLSAASLLVLQGRAEALDFLDGSKCETAGCAQRNWAELVSVTKKAAGETMARVRLRGVLKELGFDREESRRVIDPFSPALVEVQVTHRFVRGDSAVTIVEQLVSEGGSERAKGIVLSASAPQPQGATARAVDYASFREATRDFAEIRRLVESARAAR